MRLKLTDTDYIYILFSSKTKWRHREAPLFVVYTNWNKVEWGAHSWKLLMPPQGGTKN